MDWAWYLFSFKGRIDRAKLWLALLVMMCWGIFFGLVIVAIGSLLGGAKSFSFGVSDIFLIFDPATYRSPSKIDLLYLLAKLIGTPLFGWVYFATSIKRLHDRDKSGWWMVPFFVAPVLYDRIADWFDLSYAALPLALAAFVLGIWGFVEMYCLKGTHGANRFGPDPLAPPDTRPRWDQQREIEMVPHKAGPPPV